MELTNNATKDSTKFGLFENYVDARMTEKETDATRNQKQIKGWWHYSIFAVAMIAPIDLAFNSTNDSKIFNFS